MSDGSLYHSISIGDISSIDNGLHVFASIGDGESIKFRVDTGSTGIVVGRKRLKGADYRVTDDKFCLVYSSSGRRYYGHWVEAVVAFHSSQGGSPIGSVVARTEKMRIRMVETAYNGDGEPIDDPGTRMMGIGFGRDTSSGTDPDGNRIFDDINPFLVIGEMKIGNMVPGYILTPTCIILGIAPQNSQGFHTIQLVRQAPRATSRYPPSKPQWAAPNVHLAVPTANIPPMLAELLVDTGLNYSIVQAPLGTAPPQSGALDQWGNCRVQVANKQKVVITLPEIQRPIYSFSVGDAGVSPEWVSWRHNLHAGMPFVNTSMHALSSFDYLFNEQSGHLGFRFRTTESAML